MQEPTRSPGLKRAIEAAGGVAALARAIGISPKTISSNWFEPPAHRVLDIERATGIPKAVLRPDLFGAAK